MTAQIVDLGKGPQLAGSRITVLQLVQYFRRDYSYADIREIIPSLSDAEITSIEAVYRSDVPGWLAKDDAVEAYRSERSRLQHDQFPPSEGSREEMIDRLRQRMTARPQGTNGAHHPG